MPTCPDCDRTLDAGDLVRHEHERVLLVHCPDCNRVLGQYRRHGDRTGG